MSLSLEFRKVLVIVAHPDDEVLGCGATVKQLTLEGCEAKLIVLTKGVAGRYFKQEIDEQEPGLQKQLTSELKEAASIIGFNETIQLDFPDNRMDTVSKNDIALSLKKIIQEFKPNLIMTHHAGDYNWDHTITFDTVLMAARINYPEHAVEQIWSFEVLSSTERGWQDSSRAFHPNLFINIESTIEYKKKAMRCYQSEYREYPHPRCEEGIEYLARKRGLEVGVHYAEAFHIIRRLIK